MIEKKVPGPKPGAAPSPPDDAAEPVAELAKDFDPKFLDPRTIDGAQAEAAAPEDIPEGAEETTARARKRPVNVNDHIGRQLRVLYNEVVSQPIPDRFMELLDRLDAKRGEE